MEPQDPLEIPLNLRLRGCTSFAIPPHYEVTKGSPHFVCVEVRTLRSVARLLVPFDYQVTRELGDTDALAYLANLCAEELDSLRQGFSSV